MTPEDAHVELAQAVYELSPDFDPARPDLWHRSAESRRWSENFALGLLVRLPWLAAYINGSSTSVRP